MEMKDQIKFPIVGTRYLLDAIKSLPDLQIGMLLELEEDPENRHDPNAVMVLYNNVQLGFIPNSGYSCKYCWSHFPKEASECPKCGADFSAVVPGGLATRIKSSGALSSGDMFCFIDQLDVYDEYAPIRARLVLK